MKSINTLRFLAPVFVSLVACSGASQSSTAVDDGGATSSPHARPATPAEAWAADEPVPPGTPSLSDEPGPTDEPESTAPEANARGGTDPKGEVAKTSAALSTTGTSFELTYYWITQRPKDDANQVTLRDCAGKFITYASYAWRDRVRMEMTGRFTRSDGVKVTFNDWGGCWKVLGPDYPWGAGEWNPSTEASYKLRPFRSIAVDTDVLRLGKWYYVKELDGVRMPSPVSTLVHDGCVRAVDSSWSFSGRQIDFFTGLKSAYTSLDSGALAGKTSVMVYDGSAKCALHIERGY